MKKFTVYCGIFFIFIVIAPLFLVLMNKSNLQFLQVSNSKVANRDDIVKVLKNDEVLEVPLLDFIAGSIAGEMSPSSQNEAIRAQAVAIYTLLLYRQNNKAYVKSHNGADICGEPSHCLLFLTKDEIYNKWGRDGFNANYNKLLELAFSVKYKALCYEKIPINSIFFSISSGETLSCFNAFGEDLPYLQSVLSKQDEQADGFLTTIKISKKEVHKKLLELDGELVLENVENVFSNMETASSGNVLNVVIGDKNLTGVHIRKVFALRSTAFTVKGTKKDYIFTIKGYGHNVGMSQAGAIKMAEDGFSFEKILSHYYLNTELLDKNFSSK